MKNKVFLKGSGKIISFSLLLDVVSNAVSVYRSIKTQSFSDFILNFIIGLSRGTDLTIIDHDMSDGELSALGVSDANVQTQISSQTFNDISELIKCIEESKSKITIFTSGTTGLPKKVVHTVATLSRAVRSGEKHKNDIWGFAYNPTHMAGFQVFFQAFFNANTIINLFRKDASEIIREIEGNQITHLSATPTFFRLLLLEKEPHYSLKKLTCGGEKSDSSLYDRLREIFPNAKFNNVYAATEFGTLLCSQGQFFKIPEALKEFAKIENNELKVHKSLVGDFDARLLVGDFYSTGDIVEFCEDNPELFKFVGRSSSLVNVGGYKVNVEEVEDLLRAIPEISEAHVYGRKNSVTGNILCADVKLSAGKTLEKASIRSFLISKLQSFKVPRIINIVENIEITRTGKLKR